MPVIYANPPYLLKPPQKEPFESKLPAEFMLGLDNRGKWLYTEMEKNNHETEFQTRQCAFIIDRLEEGDKKFVAMEKRLVDSEKALRDMEPIRELFLSRWKIVGVITTVILAPFSVQALIEWLKIRVLGGK